ncbi:ABC transporter permease [Diplocloster agilis]|uniref:Autoinducer 2 import system permease protein LsrD n=1 Tax=Diplocloster agilis TaxID=2850323 RepID=A0A949JW19_9FIRM|nr:MULTISPECIES: ABC transporter permease [Lachnospiraceae]MBU9735144.1 ABC transporter permease [Diplocloster agilis]MCU6735466.1 ABC transporter permease [Suonthocola fibrivorans]SCJ74664.1 Autoinducer 2 import system permease protein lsrD [uncultured Clostridium sp.]
MEKIKKFRFSLNGIVLTAAFLGIVLIGTVVNENFLTMKNILSIFQQMSEMGIMALGLTIVIITGGNDLASGTTMGLCAVVSGLCLTSGMPIPLALLISLAAAVACGCLNASLVALIGIPPMIATLGTQMFFYGAALVLSKGNSISNIPREFYFLGQDKLAGLPLQAVILILLTIVLAVILKKKVFGKHLFAIGNNIKASAYSGIRTVKVLFLAYITCSVLCCIAGNIQVSRVATARADMGYSFLMPCISAVVLGGTSIDGGIGGVGGTVVGVLIFAMISNIMNLAGISSFWQQLATGSILVLVVVFNKITENSKLHLKKMAGKKAASE